MLIIIGRLCVLFFLIVQLNACKLNVKQENVCTFVQMKVLQDKIVPNKQN